MELTAVGESIVIDNLDVFKMNGFQFEIDHNGKLLLVHLELFLITSVLFSYNIAMPTKRVSLIGQPVSKNLSLGPKG